MKDLSWQSMALGGALAVALSAAIPGSGGHGSSAADASHAASLEVEVGTDGVVEATLMLDPEAPVTNLLIWSSNAVFGEPVEVEPGVWVAEAAAALEGGCYTVTAEVALGGGASGAVKKAKKTKKLASKKPKSDPPEPKSKVKRSKKRLRAASGALTLSLTATSCTPCGDDPFTPLPGVS